MQTFIKLMMVVVVLHIMIMIHVKLHVRLKLHGQKRMVFLVKIHHKLVVQTMMELILWLTSQFVMDMNIKMILHVN